MASTSHPPKKCDAVLPTLYAFIQALNIAKDACGVPPAQIALGSAGTLLTMIRARFPLLCEDEPPTHVFPGYSGQLQGVRYPWTELRECMSSTRPEIERETVGRTQPGCPRRDWRSYLVSQTSDAGGEFTIYQ